MARGLLVGFAERGSVGDNEAADVHGFQLPAHTTGLSTVSERANPHAVPHAFSAEIDADHNTAQPGKNCRMFLGEPGNFTVCRGLVLCGAYLHQKAPATGA